MVEKIDHQVALLLGDHGTRIARVRNFAEELSVGQLDYVNKNIFRLITSQVSLDFWIQVLVKSKLGRAQHVESDLLERRQGSLRRYILNFLV